MGHYYSIDVLRPDPGGDPRRSAFLRALRERLDPDPYAWPMLERWSEVRTAFPTLPLPDDLTGITAREHQGVWYWGCTALAKLGVYPKVFSDGPYLYSKSISPLWVMMVRGSGHTSDADRNEIYIGVEEARRQFSKLVDPLLSHLSYVSEGVGTLALHAPPESKAWDGVRSILSWLSPGTYIRILQFLSQSPSDALIVFDGSDRAFDSDYLDWVDPYERSLHAFNRGDFESIPEMLTRPSLVGRYTTEYLDNNTEDLLAWLALPSTDGRLYSYLVPPRLQEKYAQEGSMWGLSDDLEHTVFAYGKVARDW